jgi:hypothetical protein
MNLARDADRDDALAGYLITPIVRRSLKRVLSGLKDGETERAWSLTGPYGSGKTAFAVFLTRLLGEDSAARRSARRVLGENDPSQVRALGKKPLVPIVFSGERAPLDLLLARALKQALAVQWATRRGVRPSVFREVTRLVERIEAGKTGCMTSDVVRCFESALSAVGGAFGAGLLLIVDEAGKILEYAAERPARGDLHLFQVLAELASSNTGEPFLFIAVLHQAFDQYAVRLPAGQRNEWAKVQGRFADLIFQEEPNELIRLIGAALEPTGPRPLLPGWVGLVEAIAEPVHQGTGWDRKALLRHLEACWPLHPISAVLLGPLFRGRLAQNERSLFAFLSSSEPLGFFEFLKTQAVDALYTPDRLYDYVLATVGNSLFGRDGKVWAEIDTALRRLPPEAEVVDAKVLKVCGLLSIFGRYTGLRASRALLRLALPMGDDVDGALDRLQSASLLIYRKFRDAYQVWEGSDLDLDALVQEAVTHLPLEQPLSEVLARLVPPRPMIARRHLFHTGSLRYFEVRFIEGESLERDLVPLVTDGPVLGADGLILLIVTASQDTRRRLSESLTEARLFEALQPDYPVVAALPLSTAYMIELASELTALERIQSSTPALQADPVAHKELAARISEVRQILEQEVAQVYSADSPECEWYTTKGVLSFGSSRDLVEALSELFDLAYGLGPSIRNELLNRRELSSSAAKARRNLLEAMILRREQPRLGFVGFPPEVSMYRSVLEEHGLHRELDGRWRFVIPEGSSAMWAIVERFLEETESARRPLTELYDKLRRPPFGIKEGPLPVLVCAALLARESEVALYERGSLVSELSAPVIERLLRWPERFEVRQSRVTGVRLELLERLAHALFSGGKATKSILDLVRGLMRFVAALPSYARQTTRISTETVRVREALLRARDPAQLLFADLPVACGFPVFQAGVAAGPEEIERFLQVLRRSLGELSAAYRQLLVRVERSIQEMLGLPENGAEARAEVRVRASRVQSFAVEPLLHAFVTRSMDEALDHDEWVVSLATQLAAKPPADWVDRDYDQFGVQLAVVGRRFRSFEVMASPAVSQQAGASLVRVAVARIGAVEQEALVSIRQSETGLVERLVERIMATVQSEVPNVSRDTVVAALALLTERMLAEGVQGSGDQK